MSINNSVVAGITWLDHVREWDYSLAPITAWLWGIVEFNVVRYGPIAYVGAVLVVIMILLSFPPTRGMTKAICAAVLKGLVMYSQLVFALITVKGVTFVARVLLTLFHKCRIWLTEGVRRLRRTD